MISTDLARRLLDAGLNWSPMPGDRFVVDRPGMVHDVFHLADMTVEVHEFVGGSVIGFNGVAEWA
ncbi:MAG: pilus assembly protein CpaE, partial [Propionibacteriaceae bacterium]|nr:pilus assembly protein CpaE [Propionibacteriaceae bacterium]